MSIRARNRMTFLPFLPEFEEAVRSGKKTTTARPRAYGRAGEIVCSPFGHVRILSARRMSLGEIRDNYWREEGLSSPEEFEKVWTRLHPRTGFDPFRSVFLHRFELLQVSR